MIEIYKPRIWTDPKRFPQLKKHAMRKRVANALRDGRLHKKPCEYATCRDVRVEAHHPDYDRPLDVLWLCRSHHLELHRQT